MGMELFKTRRFLPLFVTQFMGAFNDNFFKNALLILITFKLVSTDQDPGYGAMMLNIATGIFMLPFFLFSATAGQLADKYDRAVITRILKIVEIILMSLAGIAILLISWHGAPAFFRTPVILLCILFGMGTHSTFFGPIKYALLPQHLKENELIAGNAYVEAGTYLAILGGTSFGSILIMWHYGEIIVGAGLVAVAVGGYLASRWIPASQPFAPDLKVSYNFIYETIKILKSIKKQRTIFRCVLGISWFWSIGALLLTQLPAFCKNILGGDETVVTFFLIVFTLGIGTGSVMCNRLLRGMVQTTFVPIGALGMSLFIGDLYFACNGLVHGTVLVALNEFARTFTCWRLAFDMFMLAACGGVFIVPLYALLQHRADPSETARIIAGNNIVNALFMVAAALVVVGLLALHLTIPEIFLLTALANLLVAVYICLLLPDALYRSLFRAGLYLLFRVEVRNLENYNKAGERVLIIANHTSLLDGMLIAAFMPEKVTFAINTQMAKKWWVRIGLALVDAFPMDPGKPMAAKALIMKIKENCKCMIFPEGRITVTGALMKVYEGSGMIAEKSGAMVLPIRIDGAQYSKFSYLKDKYKTRWFPKITLTILEPRRFEVDPVFKGRERRRMISSGIYDLMVDMIYHTSRIDEHLFRSLLTAADIYGSGHQIAEDQTRNLLNYRQLILKSYILGNVLRKRSGNEKYVGLMMPNSLPNVVAFWGLLAYDRIPCMINFTAGAAPVIASCTAVGIKTIFTSRKFIEMAHLENLESALKDAGLRLICLEDVKAGITISEKLYGVCRSLLRCKPAAKPDDTAAVLFTSGSEGTPKAVLLSHRNFQANRVQVLGVMPLNAQDRILNCLPMFHSFGLSMGTVLPLLSGIRTFFYPSPLHYRYIPELCYDSMVTVIFGTDTFLSGYGRMAHPYDFFSVRMAMVGAEKLRESTTRLWMEKFGIRVFEGYGATEAAPVISVNSPMYNKPGTAGRLLPGIQHRLESVPGIETGGKLLIKGDNVMLGYMRNDRPGVLQPPPEGWYDTGDIVDVDAGGFVSIKGRAKRFAKIAGEMVSLTAVETLINALWPNAINGIVTIPDQRKGEALVLVTSNLNADLAAMLKFFQEQRLSELWVPRRIIPMKHPPLLGTGKFDYVAGKKIVEEKLAAN
jgi:acyl-[acyl-carrier-protein]-phospholipid O-acyltransferase/long-chain-fatty-acid--[acyl-carrier-protein] ligase